MTQDYPKPIAPPPEITGEWWIAWDALDESERPPLEDFIAIRAAQYGADQELEACCDWLDKEGWSGESRQLRAARRPKPMSLKEQALQALSEAVKMADDVPPEGICSGQADIIRRALEQLDD
jgi:hypothetical protein